MDGIDPYVTYSPVRAPRGRLVHALALTRDSKVVCGRPRPRTGWRVALSRLNCAECKQAIEYPVTLS